MKPNRAAEALRRVAQHFEQREGACPPSGLAGVAVRDAKGRVIAVQQGPVARRRASPVEGAFVHVQRRAIRDPHRRIRTDESGRAPVVVEHDGSQDPIGGVQHAQERLGHHRAPFAMECAVLECGEGGARHFDGAVKTRVSGREPRVATDCCDPGPWNHGPHGRRQQMNTASLERFGVRERPIADGLKRTA